MAGPEQVTNGHDGTTGAFSTFNNAVFKVKAANWREGTLMLSGFGLLPLIVAWVGLLLLAQDLAARGVIGKGWTLHWALVSVAWGTLLALMVEVASLFGWVCGPVLLAAWLCIDAALLLILFRRREAVAESCRVAANAIRQMWANCPWDAAIVLGMVAALAVVLSGIAVVTPTTNWDSLTYHLPRMLHWLQQGSVEHFPTNNFRQVQFAPWASYALMHLYVFTGGDQFLNLVQSAAMLSTLVVASFIVVALARRSGVAVDFRSGEHGPRSWRMVTFTSLLVATIPIGVIESGTTQNDYVVTFWFCCAVAFGLALVAEPGRTLYAVAAGAALGLATLTKSTAFVYAAPFVIAFTFWWLLRVDTVRQRARIAAGVCSCFLLLNSGPMLRNKAATGSPLGSPEIFKIERNERLTVRNGCSNLIRNLSLNSNSGFPMVTRAFNRALEAAHKLTGVDLNHPATTYHGCVFFFREKFIVMDSYTSNTWHVVLFVIAGIAALVRPRPHTGVLLFGGLIVAGFLVFCFYLKWQWWHSRLHLGFLVLAAPLAGIVLTRNLPRIAVVIVSAFLTLFAAFTLVKNQSRPIFSAEFRKLPREQKYMAIDGPHLSLPLGFVADAIVASESQRVGLNLPFDAAEYPLWIMLRNRAFDGRISHVTPGQLDHDVVICSEESPWTIDASTYPYLRRAGYYTVRWKKQPSFPVEIVSRQ